MRTIKAYVGKDMLSVVDRLFQADLRSIVTELAQNSRRAGATELRIDVEPAEGGAAGCVVELSDNGSGMVEPDELLGLRVSGWADAQVLDEDPAGMGFFVLSGLPWAEVRSGNWKITLTQESFKGADVLVESASEVRGMRVRFPQAATIHTVRADLRHSMESFFSLCGLAVFRDGSLVAQREYGPSSRRDDCLKVSYEDLGVDVIAYSTSCPYAFPGPSSGGTFSFNFFGFTGVCGMPTIPEVTVMVNIRHARCIKPVLPARRALVANDALADLTARLEKLAYCLVAGNHALPYHHYLRAKELGVDIGEPRKRLIRVVADRQHELFDLTDKACLISRPDRAGEWQNCAGATLDNFVLYLKHASYQGYAWYDALPVVRACRVKVDGLTLVEELDEDEEAGVLLWDSAPQRGNLTVEFDVETKGKTETHVALLDVALRPEGERESDPYSIATFIVDSAITPDSVNAIVDVLEAAWMPREWPAEDGEDYWRRCVKSTVSSIVAPTYSVDYGAMFAAGAADSAVLHLTAAGFDEREVRIDLTKDVGSYRWRYSWASVGADAGQAIYRMVVTRTTRETAVVELDAPGVAAASQLAMKMASSGENHLEWEKSGEPTYLATREGAPRSEV